MSEAIQNSLSPRESEGAHAAGMGRVRVTPSPITLTLPRFALLPSPNGRGTI